MGITDDLKTGKIGEQAFWDYCQNEDWVRNVIDVRQDERARQYDIDFVVETTKRQFHFFEVKADTQIARTGNIYFEKTSCGNVGCLERSKADFIAYYDIENNVFYIMNMEKLRQYIRCSNIKPLQASVKTTGYIISIYDLLALKIAKKVEV